MQSAPFVEFESSQSFDETMVRLRKAVDAASWAILGSYDFGETLAGKGFAQQEKYRTLEVCNAKHADHMLQIQPRVALCMPCTLLVRTEGTKVLVAAMLPSVILPAAYADCAEALATSAQAIDVQLTAILQAAI